MREYILNVPETTNLSACACYVDNLADSADCGGLLVCLFVGMTMPPDVELNVTQLLKLSTFNF